MKDIIKFLLALLKTPYPVILTILIIYLVLILKNVNYIASLVCVLLLCIISATFKYLIIKFGKYEGAVSVNGETNVEEILHHDVKKFFEILDKKGIKKLKDIEKDIKNLKKKVYFIIESGESAPYIRTEKYLFSWDNAFKKESEKLKEYLIKNLKIDWIKNSEIKKNLSNNIINFLGGGKSLALKLHKAKKNVTIETNGEIMHEFNFKEENGRLKIYDKIGSSPSFFSQFTKKYLEPKYKIFKLGVPGTSSFLVFSEEHPDKLSGEKIIEKYYQFVEDEYKEIINSLREEDKYKFIFCWDYVPGKHRARLLKYLSDELKVGWAKKPRIIIRKSKDNKTISVQKKKNVITLSINQKEMKVFMELGSGSIFEYHIKNENGKSKIYENREEAFIKWYSAFSENRKSFVLITRPYGLSLLSLINLLSDKISKEEYASLFSEINDLMKQETTTYQIKISFLLEAVGFEESTIDKFKKIESEVITELGKEYGKKLKKYYFSFLLNQKDFISKFEENFESTDKALYNSIKNDGRYDEFKNLVKNIQRQIFGLELKQQKIGL